MSYLNELILQRRSIRQYLPDPVPHSSLISILEAGRLAPFAKNSQNWKFTAVLNPTLRHAIAATCQNPQMILEAPVSLVVWATDNFQMRCGQMNAPVDCSIALSFMVLKATELGLGTCWLGAFDANSARLAIGLPENAEIIAITPLGFPAEAPPARPRKAANEIYDIKE